VSVVAARRLRERPPVWGGKQPTRPDTHRGSELNLCRVRAESSDIPFQIVDSLLTYSSGEPRGIEHAVEVRYTPIAARGQLLTRFGSRASFADPASVQKRLRSLSAQFYDFRLVRCSDCYRPRTDASHHGARRTPGQRRSRRTSRAGQQRLAVRDQRMALSWPLPDSRKECCSNTRSERSWPRPSFYRARRGTPSRRAGRG